MYTRTPMQFITAMTGIPAHHVAKALTHLTPGIDWTGCNKPSMARKWADALDPAKAEYRQLKSVDLPTLEAMAKARANGKHQWYTARPEARTAPPADLADRLRAMLPQAEWRDKVIHYVGEPAAQHFALTLYLPVPVGAKDKSAEAALQRFLDQGV